MATQPSSAVRSLSATLLAALAAIACVGISRSQTNGVERDDSTTRPASSISRE